MGENEEKEEIGRKFGDYGKSEIYHWRLHFDFEIEKWNFHSK